MTAHPAPLPQDRPVIRFADHLTAELQAGAFGSKGERTRQRLRIAAAAALEEGGYPALKIADICARADVALGTFYLYFRDKAAVATDVVLAFIDHLYDCARAVSRGTDNYQTIYNTNLFFVLAYRENPGLMRSHMQLQSLEPDFRALWSARHRRWLETLGRSVHRRSNLPGLTPEMALKVAAVLEGMVYNYLYSAAVTGTSLSEPAGGDPHELARMLSLIWYRGVHGADPAGF